MNLRQTLDRCTYNVDRVARAITLGKYVTYSGCFENSAHRTTGDYASTFRCRLHVDHRRAMATLLGVLQRVVVQVYRDHVATGGLHRFLDCDRHFTCLAVTEAHAALAVSNNGQCGKAELAPALHNLGDAVDGNQFFNEVIASLIL